MDDNIKKTLEEFESRKIYTKLDEDTLNDIKDENLEQAIIDYIYNKVGDRFDKEYEIVTGMSKGFRAIYTTWWVEAEVNNGGFNQYF